MSEPGCLGPQPLSTRLEVQKEHRFIATNSPPQETEIRGGVKTFIIVCGDKLGFSY